MTTLSKSQQRIIDVLNDASSYGLSLEAVLQIARCSEETWWRGLMRPTFVEALQTVANSPDLNWMTRHGSVQPVSRDDLLSSDIWDMRGYVATYSQHNAPSRFILDFSFLTHTHLKYAVKLYLLAKSRSARSYKNTFDKLTPFLQQLQTILSPDERLGTLTRDHIEIVLGRLHKLSENQRHDCLLQARACLDYMATEPTWSGPRPPQDLILPEDMNPRPMTQPNPIPHDVLTQLDALLSQAVDAMTRNEEPPLLDAVTWDAILILRRTGLRFVDLAQLRIADAQGRNASLHQDQANDHWLAVDNPKSGRPMSLPLDDRDGVREAIERQTQRVVGMKQSGRFLWWSPIGLIRYAGFVISLQKLAPFLLHVGQPYEITPHQFRHTIATDMIEHGVSILLIQLFLGHSNLSDTERYIATYRAGSQQPSQVFQKIISEMIGGVQVAPPPSAHPDNQISWAPGRKGIVYSFVHPSCLGRCHLLASQEPQCGRCRLTECVGLRATQEHLTAWQHYHEALRTTRSSARTNGVSEHILHHLDDEIGRVEVIICEIKKTGVWNGAWSGFHDDN